MNGGRHIAILIGNSEFPEEPSLSALRCPQRDVEGLAAALTAQETGLFADPLIFINEPHHKVLPAINRVFKQASRQDQILIYYSGHGKQDSAGSLHLATADTEVDALETTSIAVDSFRQLIDNYACKQVALILDCCFGGAAGKDFLKGGVDDQLQQVGRGIYVLTASTAIQTAREKDGDEYSLLTKHILHGIKHGEADQDDDGLVSMDDLYEYVRARVPSEAPQHPMKWSLGIQGGEFFIARAVKYYGPERLHAFRERINSLYRYLPEEVSDQAIQVIRARQPKQDKEFMLLLEALSENRVDVGEFISRWLSLGLPFSVQQQRELVAQRQRELEEQRQAEAARQAEELWQRELEEQRQRELEERQAKEERRRKLEKQRRQKERRQAEAARQAERQWQQEEQRRHSKRYFFSWRELRLIGKQNPILQWWQNRGVKQALLNASKRWLRFRLAWATLPVLLAITAAIIWNSQWGQLQLIKLVSRYEYQKGRKAYEDKSYEEAINHFTKAIERNPQNQDAYVFRGRAKSDLGDKQSAIGDYNKALEIDPKYALAYNNRGRAKSDLGDKQGAIGDYNKALEINPKYALAYNNRGRAKSDLGDKQGAIGDYSKALEINPKYALAYTNRGFAKSALGDKQGAIGDYSKALEIDPKYAWAYNNRGLAKSDLGDKQGAIGDYNKALEIDPKYAAVYYNRGFAKSALGDKQGAIGDYNKALEIDPKDAWAYNNRGFAKSALGDKQGAIGDYSKALEIDPKYALAYTNRGNAKSDLGDKQGAITDWISAARLGDENVRKWLKENGHSWQ